MHAQPAKEHGWLKKFLGEWTYEVESDSASDDCAKSSGTESVRPIGDLWVIAEGNGTMPGGAPATSVLTLGYDPEKKQFVGTWLGSMMSNLWIYEMGTLDESRNRLTLECDGPSFSEEDRANGKTARYRDVIEFRGDDHRVLSGSVLGDDGNWTTFMTTHYRRKK